MKEVLEIVNIPDRFELGVGKPMEGSDDPCTIVIKFDDQPFQLSLADAMDLQKNLRDIIMPIALMELQKVTEKDLLNAIHEVVDHIKKEMEEQENTSRN